MSRSARATLLMFALLWQALVWLTPQGQTQQMQEMANRMIHTKSVDHHHHNDKSLHVDDSADSQIHHHANDAVQPAGLVPSSADYKAATSPTALPVAHASEWLSAWLEGPLRPPQALV